MNTWILIAVIIGAKTEAVEHIEFNSRESCLSAAQTMVNSFAESDAGWIKRTGERSIIYCTEK